MLTFFCWNSNGVTARTVFSEKTSCIVRCRVLLSGCITFLHIALFFDTLTLSDFTDSSIFHVPLLTVLLSCITWFWIHCLGPLVDLCSVTPARRNVQKRRCHIPRILFLILSHILLYLNAALFVAWRFEDQSPFLTYGMLTMLVLHALHTLTFLSQPKTSSDSGTITTGSRTPLAHVRGLRTDSMASRDTFAAVEQRPQHLNSLNSTMEDTYPHFLSNTSSDTFLDVSLISRDEEEDAENSVAQLLSMNFSAERHARGCSYLFFKWATPMFLLGEREALRSLEDLLPLPQTLLPRGCHARLSSLGFSKVGETKLFPALWRTFGREYLLIGGLKFAADVFTLLIPITLSFFTQYLVSSNATTPEEARPIWHGLLLASALFLCSLFTAFFSVHYTFQVQRISLKVQGGLMSLLYRKILHVRLVDLNSFTQGEIINFLTADVGRVVNFCNSFHEVWSMPVQFVVALVLLYLQVDYAAFTGILFMALVVPLNKWLANQIGRYSKRMMEMKDARVKTMSELLAGIRNIKLFGWEELFVQKVNVSRTAELKALRGQKFLDAFCVFFWAASPAVIAVLTFGTYTYFMERQLTAAKVFTSLALFSLLLKPMNAFPWVINGLVEALVSMRRIEPFLRLSNKLPLPVMLGNGQLQRTVSRDSEDVLISVDHVNFGWTTAEQENFLLREIVLKLKKGQFSVLLGRVGCGKSSLLLGLLQELHYRGPAAAMSTSRGDPSFQMSHSTLTIAFIGHTPWIQAGSIRENILFGSLYEHDWYISVLKACALEEDLNAMPRGDLTQVGERGFSLSGGQRARVCLARAVYQKADVYLLDDPLAAVDAHVGETIMRRCILGESALLRRLGAAVLITTHNPRWVYGTTDGLLAADEIFHMEGGQIVRREKPTPASAYDSHQTQSESRGMTTSVEETVRSGEPVLEESEEVCESGSLKWDVYAAYVNAVGCCLTLLVLLALVLMQAGSNICDWWLSYWMNAEQKQRNSSTKLTLSTASLPYSSAHLWSLDAWNGFSTWVQPLHPHWLLTSPVDDNNNEQTDMHFYLMVYGYLSAFVVVVTLFRAFLFAYGGIRSARRLHEKLLRRVLQAYVHFFDVTPMGRILNRFSSDICAIDDSLPFQLNIFLAVSVGLTGALSVASYGAPPLLLCLLPLTFVYWSVQEKYRATSRELKRISSVSRSPLYSLFCESLQGNVIIRGHHQTPRFESECFTRLSRSIQADYNLSVAANWLSVRLQTLGVAVLLAVLVFVCCGHVAGWVQVSFVGLATVYALSVTALMNSLVLTATETEKQFIAVERCQEYVDTIPSERTPLDDTRHSAVSPSWPHQGELEFRNVSLVYPGSKRNRLPVVPVTLATDNSRWRDTQPTLEMDKLALNNISFNISPGQRVALIGRTGSGKSSVLKALTRLLPHRGANRLGTGPSPGVAGGGFWMGDIFLDHVHIAKDVSLKQLRSSIAVISQEAFVFTGTVRENVDPFGECSVDVLEHILSKCGLHHLCGPALDHTLGEEGCLLSAGQKQLLSMARILVSHRRHPVKLLCMDEATSAVDLETDRIILEMAAREFPGVTILVIAHRLDTVVALTDMVIVLHNGEVVEQGATEDLMLNPNSYVRRFLSKQQSMEEMNK